MDACLIQQQLHKIKKSAPSRAEFTAFLRLLHNIINNLVSHSSEEKFKTIKKGNKLFSRRLVNAQEAEELLIHLGYKEENDKFLHITSDENVGYLCNLLELVQRYIQQQESLILSEIFDKESQEGETKYRSQPAFSPNEKSPERKCPEKVKKFFLMKQLQKESSDNLTTGLNLNQKYKSKSKSPDYAFNAKGYFQQSCAGIQRDPRKKKSIMKDFFHAQENEARKLHSSSLNRKLL